MSENFEKRVKNILDEVQFEPHGEVWNNVKNAIKPAKKRRRFMFWWLLPFVLAGGIFAYIMIDSGDGNIIEDNSIEKSKTIAPVTPGKIAKGEIKSHQDKKKSNGSPVGTWDSFIPVVVPNYVPTGKINPINVSQHLIEEKRMQPALTPVISSNVSGIDGSKESTESIAVDEVKNNLTGEPSLPTQIQDTIKTESIGVTNKPKNKVSNNWKFGISAEIGISNTVKGLLMNSSSSSRVNFNTIPNTTSSGSLGSAFYKRVTTAGKPLFGIGIAAQKNISSKGSFQSVLGYQHHQFSQTAMIFKDSASPVLIERYTTQTALNFINLYTGISYRLTEFDGFKISFGAGVDNEFLIALQNEQKKYLYNSGQSISEKNNSVKDYNAWQPHLRLQLITDILSAKGNTFQLSPYLRYGVRKLEKTADKNHLMSFGVTGTYFFR